MVPTQLWREQEWSKTLFFELEVLTGWLPVRHKAAGQVSVVAGLLPENLLVRLPNRVAA